MNGANAMTGNRTCGQCGKSFEVIPSRLKHGRGKHCSPSCQYANRRASQKSRVVLTCLGCGKAFDRWPSHARGNKGKYCTRECRDAHWIGARNPNWQNAGREYKRGPHWSAIKRRIRNLDGCCVRCGATGDLHVHHIVPFRMFADAAQANSDENLVTLCAPCHRREDSKFKWVRFDSGAVLRFGSGGAAWALARERGVV